jgi:hypothetical protein
MAEKRLPDATAISNLLTNLIGKRVKIVKGPPMAPAAAGGIASYVDAAGALQFAVIVDLKALGSIGAALAMIPAAMVEEAVKSGKPSSALTENAYEVLNIAASVFNEVEGTTLHVKIKGLTLPPIPPGATKWIAAAKSRLDFDLGIPGYPDGKISFVSAV